MSLKSFLLLGVISIASIVGAADTLMAQAEIEPGKWCNDYLAARAYALERNVPMLVIWNNPGSFYCEQLEKACAQPDFVSWQEERKIVMVFVVGKDTPTQQAAYDWIRSVREIVDYPYVGVYWLNNSAGVTVETVFVGRNGKMPETDGSLQKQLMSTIDSLVVDWDPSVNSKLTPFKPIDDDEPVVTNTVTYAGLDSAINTNVTKFTASDLPLSLGPLEQAGWRFIGWTPNDGVIPAGTLTNVSFTAKWEQIVEKKLDGGPYSEIIGGIEWTYFVKNDESEVCGCSTAVGAIKIPKTLGCCPVTRIGSYAFSGCIELTSVTIPDGVTGIGTDAFSGCSGLISIEIPSTVKMIDWGVFRYCNKLESVTMPNCVDRLSDVFPESCQTITNVVICDGVKCIKSRAFENCKGLASVDIPSSVTEIEERAFAGCTSLKSVAIPNGVSRIGFLAFEDCSSLEYVEISDVSAWCRIDFSNSLESNPAYYGHRLILGNKELRDLDIPDDVTEISGFAFAGCKRLRSVNMSASVTNIAVGAFYGCDNIFGFNVDQDNSNYTSVWGGLCTKDGKTLIAGVGIYGHTIIPDGVTQIGDYAYSDNNVLTSVRISTNVISVAKSAFSGCSKIRYVTMPPCITELGEYFSGAYEKINQVDILDGVTRICDRAFNGCSGLTSVTISSSVTNIGNYAFGGCKKLSSLYIPQSVTHIGDFAFKDCRLLSSIFIPSNVTEIGIDVFSGCDQIKSVTVPACVKKLSEVFPSAYPAIENVVILEGTTSIVANAFDGCAGLLSVTIPTTVTNIEVDAFRGCDSLAVVYVSDEPQECVKKCFGDRVWYQKIGTPINYQWVYVCEDGNATITGVRPAYGDVVVPSSCDGFPVTSIGESAFAGCGGLTSVTIPDCVTNFGYDAFAGCTNLNVFLECNCPENYEGSGITSVRSVEFWCDNLESYPVAEERIDSTYIGSSCALVIDADDGKTYTQFVGEMEPSSSLSEYCRLAIGCNGEIRFLRPEEYSITLHYGWKHIVARIEGEYADRWHLVLGNPAFREYIGNNDEWFYQYWNRGSLAERDDCRRGDVIAITPQDGDWPWIYYSEFDYQMGEYADFLDGIYYYYLPVVDDVDVMYYPEYAYGRYSGLVVNIDVPGRNTEFYVKPESDPIFVEYDLGLPAGNVVVKSYQPDWEIRDPWYGEWVDIKPYYNAYTMTDCECGECVDYPYYVLHQPGWTVADGWRFVGWKDDQGTFCENIYIDWYPSYEDSVRFEAQYELIQYGLTYVDEKGFVLSNPQEFNVTDAVDLEEPPNVFGWLFLGWFDESENRITNTSQLSAQDHTLTAKWEQIYHEVLFNPGAHGRLRNVKLVKQNIARGAQAAVPEIDLAPGWRFLGWDGDVTQPITNDVTFTAQYEAIEYKLSFEGLKGAAVDYPTTFTVTNSISLVPLADTEDFRFDYWLVNGEIADMIPVGTAVDTVVVAHWTPFVKLGEGGITGWSGMYDGTEHTVSVFVAEPESYSVSCSRLVSGLPTGSWTSMKDVGTVAVRVTVSAEGYAPILRDVTVDITARPLSTCTLEASGVANYINGPVTWSKRAYDPVAKTTLSDSRDYSVSFVQTGDFTGRATFTGRGNYTGTENVQTVISITTPFEKVGNTTWYYQQSADKATLVRRGDAIASSLTGAVVIPDTVNGLPVTEIADGAFANCSEVTAFVIPEGVAILGDGVFAGCSALKSVVFLGDAPEAPRTFGGAPAELIVYAMPGSRGWGAPVHDVLPERWPFGDDESLTRVIAWLPEVEITPTTGIRSGRVAVTMNYAGVPGIEREIRYASDGTDPVAASTLYDKRFSLNVDEKTVVKAAAFCGGYRFGSVSSSTFLTSLEEVIVNEGSGAVVLANDVASPWTYDDAELGCGGKACLRSGAIGDNGTSSLTATFEGEGLLSFSWKTSCEYDDFGEFFFDHAECLLDGVVVAQADGKTDWADVEIPVSGKGAHSLVWRYVKDDADEDGADYEDCVWLGNVAFSCAENELQPTVVGDEGAVVTGDEEIGFVIRPSGTKTVVEVEIPTGLDAAKVTVEVTVAVTSLKSNGAKVKIVSGGADITEFLDLPSADGEGVIDLSRAAVRSEIVNEVLDPEKGAVIELTPDSPTLTTVNTRPGLVYTLHEGAALDGMTSGDSKVGDGEPWTPDITVKGGNSAFYFISVGK